MKPCVCVCVCEVVIKDASGFVCVCVCVCVSMLSFPRGAVLALDTTTSTSVPRCEPVISVTS